MDTPLHAPRQHPTENKQRGFTINFESLGFDRPHFDYCKADPRGPEYGNFEVSITGNRITVHHQHYGYTFYFDCADSFHRWARSCT